MIKKEVDYDPYAAFPTHLDSTEGVMNRYFFLSLIVLENLDKMAKVIKTLNPER